MPFRITSILVASDRSESAREAIHSAGALAALTEAELHVVHAVDPGTSPAAERAAFTALGDEVRGTLPGARDATSLRVRRGEPPAAILQRAEEVEADLVVVGAHRERPGETGRLGTTADRIVRVSARPCLVVRSRVSLPLRAIVAPTDLSAAAEIALEVALTWGAALRMPDTSGGVTHLDVLHVAPVATDDDGLRERLGEHIQAALERVGGRTALELRPAVRAAADPTPEILSLAHDGGADLIVMATRSRPTGATEMGSVSSAVARESGCPVLLVPPVMWRTRRGVEAALRAG